MEAQRAGALKRRDFAASTCGAFPRHSAASRLQSTNPLSPQVRARLSRESANRCFVASKSEADGRDVVHQADGLSAPQLRCGVERRRALFGPKKQAPDVQAVAAEEAEAAVMPHQEPLRLGLEVKRRSLPVAQIDPELGAAPLGPPGLPR